MFQNLNKILVVAAHPDDEVIGCGATIAKHAMNGDEVQIIFMSDGESSRNTINKNLLQKKINKRQISAKNFCKYLNIKKPIFLNLKDNEMDKYSTLYIVKKIEKLIQKFKPNIVYTHFFYDLNIDHQITNRCVMTACRPYVFKFIKLILAFEIASSTDLNPDISKRFSPNFYNDVTKYIKFKKTSLNYYSDEMRTYPHPRSINSIIEKSKIRGSEIDCRNAETFMILRMINE